MVIINRDLKVGDKVEYGSNYEVGTKTKIVHMYRGMYYATAKHADKEVILCDFDIHQKLK